MTSAGDETDYYSEDAATFGDRVAAAREAAGLSQSDLARRLGVKLKTVTGWENDTSEPRANKLQMLAGMLGVSIRWLLTGEGDGLPDPEEAPATPAGVTGALMEMHQLRAEFGRLTDRLGQLEKRLRATLHEG